MYESNLLPSRQPNTKKKLPNLGVPAPKQSVCLSLLCPALFFSFQRKSFFLKKRFQHWVEPEATLSLHLLIWHRSGVFVFLLFFSSHRSYFQSWLLTYDFSRKWTWYAMSTFMRTVTYN